jgi:hypothetical protein
VEVEAVLRRVVEPAQRGKHVVAEVGKAGVQRHLRAQADKLAEQRIERPGILQAAGLNGAPGSFAHLAVGVFEAVGGLGQR